MNIVIDGIKENDLKGLSELYKQFRGEESSLEKMQPSFRRLSNNPYYLFLSAKIDSNLVGSVMGISLLASPTIKKDVQRRAKPTVYGNRRCSCRQES